MLSAFTSSFINDSVLLSRTTQDIHLFFHLSIRLVVDIGSGAHQSMFFADKTPFYANIFRRNMPLFSQNTRDTCSMCRAMPRKIHSLFKCYHISWPFWNYSDAITIRYMPNPFPVMTYILILIANSQIRRQIF
jgi:hypothetical protein